MGTGALLRRSLLVVDLYPAGGANLRDPAGLVLSSHTFRPETTP
jgi:hypothetical protein